MKPINRPFDVSHYRLGFTMDPGSDPKTFPATVDITLTAKKSLKEIELDAEEMKISSARFLGKKEDLSYEQTKENKLLIRFPKALKKDEKVKLSIDYTAQIRSAHNGLFRVTDPDASERGPLFFTHLEPLAARKLFPCNDEPHDKATTEIVAELPDGYEVHSNGEEVENKKFTKDGKAWRRAHWYLGKPHPTYLVALAVGKFGTISTKSGKTKLTVSVGDRKLDRAKYTLDVTKQSLQFFEDYLGVKYPWPQYATIGIPTFLWGGMENTASTHMNEERTCLNDLTSSVEKKRITNLAAHELAHQWFGDYVTMKWWDDVWLNESFATLMGTLATEHVFKSEEPLIESVTEAWNDYFRQEDGPRSHPIVDKELKSIDDAFDSINYTKGENILRMLSYYVGEKKFRKGVKQYLKNFEYGNANYEDFFKTMEQASGEKLKNFKQSWILRRGYPILSYSGEWVASTRSYALTLSQRPNHSEDDTVFDFRLPVVFHRKEAPAYDIETTLNVTKASQIFDRKLPAQPEWVTINPRSTVLAKWAPLEWDEELIAKQALKDPDSLTRVWATFALISPLKQGQNKITELSERTVLKLLEEDPSPYVRNAVLEQLTISKTRWLPEKLGNGIFRLAEQPISVEGDPHGWNQFRATLYGTLGKVRHSKSLSFLSSLLEKGDLPLDDLTKVAAAVAMQGDDKSAKVLRQALTTHAGRGYRYKFVIQYAFGAYENTNAAEEIAKISKEAGSDLMGRIGWVVTDNHTLKTSKEWAEFLKDFALHNDRFGDEVKARILNSIEEVKNGHVKDLLEALVRESKSERLKEVSRKILDKNFSG